MNTKELIERTSTVKTTAVFSKSGAERYALTMEWDSSKESAVIIMTFPSSADDLILDQTTMLCRNNAVKNGFGVLTIVNLFSTVGGDNPHIDKLNSSHIMKACESADKIIVAYGRKTSYDNEKQALLEALEPYSDKLYTIIDKRGLGYSHPLSPSAHEWKIVPIKACAESSAIV